MEKIYLKRIGPELLCLALLIGGGVAFADEETGAVTNESLVPVEVPAVETPLVEEPSAPPQKVVPTIRGADLGAAFKGAGSSKFGVSGRVNKMPAKKSAKKAKGDWQRRIELGASTAQGNSETLRYNGAISGSKETLQDYYFLKLAGRYGESEQEKDTANASGEAKYQHRLSERMYTAVDGNVLHDQIAGLSYRARGSLSLGRHFIWTERTVLSVEAGPGYVAEKKGDEKESFVAGRVAQYLEFLITPSLQIWESVEYVPSLEDTAVYFVNSEVGLETVLMANLSLRFMIENRYDSQPAAGKKNNDLLTTTSLSWSF